ncbi:uncharacterized protein LOC114478062 [Gouania willdenowi]|uniref:Uncharacterized LOC114478062 n=1 Tax=Gouania willdenowi TaxID=441366 RepID=A0A8C5E153_GOUWI|nr:uncharacterized protein LOC114478062 [Gouania willdenowi]
MSLTVTSAEGTAEFTMTFDPNNTNPRLHQTMKALCCPASLCSSSPRLKVASLSVLGTLQMMVALISISLTLIVFDFGGPDIWWYRNKFNLAFPFWVGSLFLLCSVVCIVASQVSSPLCVCTNLFLQLTGVCFGIVSLVISTINMTQFNLSWFCDDQHNNFYRWKFDQMNSSSPYDTLMKKCLEAKELLQVLLWSINAMLIVLALLQLCVSISSTSLTFKALTYNKKEPNQSAGVGNTTSDPQCPGLLYGQILKAFLYSPKFCGVTQHLRIRSNNVVGALLILTSVISVGLQDVINLPPGNDPQRIAVKFQSMEAWVIVFGVLSILSVRFPTRCLLIVNVINQLIGVGLSITSIVCYGVAATDDQVGLVCDPDNKPDEATSTPSPYEMKMKRDCLEKKDSIKTLLRWIYFLLILLKVFQIFVFNCSTALGIRALSCTATHEARTPTGTKDPREFKPLLEEVNNDSAEFRIKKSSCLHHCNTFIPTNNCNLIL